MKLRELVQNFYRTIVNLWIRFCYLFRYRDWTGILLLVAAHMGIKHLVGIDIEEYAAKQARINCDNNHVVADYHLWNLDTDFKGTAQLILANLTVDPLKILLPQIGKKLDDKGILIISGILMIGMMRLCLILIKSGILLRSALLDLGIHLRWKNDEKDIYSYTIR